MPNNPNKPHSAPNRNDSKDLAVKFAKLVESDIELDEKAKKELLNSILKND